MNDDLTFYVLRDLSGKYVALDKNSGGYPYLTGSFKNAEHFDSFEQAFRYKGVFSRNQFNSDNWRIVRCEVTQQIISVKSYLEGKNPS